MNKSHRVVYTPESRLRHPIQLFREMGQDLLASRELAWRLLVRDISAQYRQSLFGFAWAFVPPIVTAIGLVVAKNVGAVNIAQTDIPYAAYVMFSMTLWQTFTESLNGPITALSSAKPMLAKINFPKEAIILSQLGQVFFNFGIKLFLIVGLFVWFHVPVGWTVFLAPVALIHLIIFGTFIGLFLSPISVLYGDISKALPLILTPWLLITPVIFPVPTSGLFATIVNLNPVTPLLVTIRELAIGLPLSNSTGFWVASVLGWLGLILSWIFYRLTMPFIVERISS